MRAYLTHYDKDYIALEFSELNTTLVPVEDAKKLVDLINEQIALAEKLGD